MLAFNVGRWYTGIAAHLHADFDEVEGVRADARNDGRDPPLQKSLDLVRQDVPLSWHCGCHLVLMWALRWRVLLWVVHLMVHVDLGWHCFHPLPQGGVTLFPFSGAELIALHF